MKRFDLTKKQTTDALLAICDLVDVFKFTAFLIGCELKDRLDRAFGVGNWRKR